MRREAITLLLVALTTVPGCITPPPIDAIPDRGARLATTTGAPMLQVLLTRDGAPRSPCVRIDGAFVASVRGARGSWREVSRGPELPLSSVDAVPGGFRLGGRDLQGEALLLATADGGRIWVDGTAYAGQGVIFEPDGEALRVLHRVDLETYTAGVVAGEMPATFSREALRAQAVLARTYALRRMRGDGGSAEPTVRDDVFDQVYRGEVPAFSAAARAAHDTAGRILTLRGRPFLPYYHSTCGGWTAGLEAAFGSSSPDAIVRAAHESVRCERCTASPAFRWTATIPADRVRAALAALDVPGRMLQSLSGTRRDAAGRWIRARLRTEDAETEVSAARLRLAIGPSELKSTWITDVSVVDGSLHATGRGYGHGAGMCQWGAQGMAMEGRDYRTILLHYYPSARLDRAYP